MDILQIVPNNSVQTVGNQGDSKLLVRQSVTSKMIISTHEQNMAESAGDQTDLHIDNLLIHM